MVRRREIVTMKGAADIIEAYQDAIAKHPKRVKNELEKLGAKKTGRMYNTLRKYPGKPRYPLRWKSEKQRRAFFATDGFGKGIPYRRTGNLANGWKVSIDKSRDLEFAVYNRMEYARYVVGDDQQPFHVDTGWLFAPRYLMAEREKLQDELIETYVNLDPLEGA